MHKYAKDFFGTKKYLTAIGIRADETQRLTNNSNLIYPLAQAKIDEKYIRAWWHNNAFDLELKDYQGNCDLCFLKSVRKKRTIIKEDPTIADWWLEMESKYGEYYEYEDVEYTYNDFGEQIEVSRKKINARHIFDAHRGLSITDLIGLAQSDFNLAKDKHDISLMQTNLFGIDLDEDFDCFCKG